MTVFLCSKGVIQRCFHVLTLLFFPVIIVKEVGKRSKGVMQDWLCVLTLTQRGTTLVDIWSSCSPTGTDSHHLAGSAIYKLEHLALSSLFYLLMCQV